MAATQVTYNPQVNTTQLLNETLISWTENMLRGFTNLVVHFLMPLNEFGFDFNCLFSNKPVCRSRKIRKTGEIVDVPRSIKIQIVSPGGDNARDPSKGYLVAGTNYLVKHFRALVRRLLPGKGSVDKAPKLKIVKMRESSKPSQYSLVATNQLMACTILCSIYLIRDLRYVLKVIKRRPVF